LKNNKKHQKNGASFAFLRTFVFILEFSTILHLYFRKIPWRTTMYIKKNQQQGSFFAEVSATIAAISILTLIGTNYVDSQAGRAQVAEAFVLMQPIVENVNNFYSQHGTIGGSASNYDGINVYDNDLSSGVQPNVVDNTPHDYAGRYVKEVTSYSNGVVAATMNTQFSDATYADDTVGKVGNVQTAIQGETVFLVPFLIGETSTGNASENTSLRWACLTTIDANPPTGKTIPALSGTPGSEVINEQYFYAPGCVVISGAQANCLTGNSTATTYSTQACGIGTHNAPVNWNETLYSVVS
jgi:hypothetical protein